MSEIDAPKKESAKADLSGLSELAYDKISGPASLSALNAFLSFARPLIFGEAALLILTTGARAIKAFIRCLKKSVFSQRAANIYVVP